MSIKKMTSVDRIIVFHMILQLEEGFYIDELKIRLEILLIRVITALRHGRIRDPGLL